MPKRLLIDTNVIVRFLVEDPEKVDKKFSGVFTFFPKIERGEISVELPEIVLFETFFVLTKVYRVPTAEASSSLAQLIDFRGIVMIDKVTMKLCLSRIIHDNVSLVDAYLMALSERNAMKSIYSYDSDLRKRGLALAPIK